MNSKTNLLILHEKQALLTRKKINQTPIGKGTNPAKKNKNLTRVGLQISAGLVLSGLSGKELFVCAGHELELA